MKGKDCMGRPPDKNRQGGHAGALRGVSKERRVGKGRELSKNTLYHLYAISHCIHSINLIPPLQNKEYFIMTKGIIQ